MTSRCHDRKLSQCVAKKIRTLRQERHMSQTELGKSCGISFQQIQKYESGSNRVSADALWLISQRLQVPVAHFFPNGDDIPLVPHNLKGSIKSLVEQARRIADQLP